MRKARPFFSLSTIVITAALSSQAYALETTGYIRTGINWNKGDVKNGCFILPGAKSKYRLGNECEQYTEFLLRENLKEFEDGSILSVEGMPAITNPYGRSLDFNEGSGGFVRLVQGFASWRNVPALNGGSVWAGRRYYNRKDIGMSDFVYWNQSATGFGLDKVKIGSLYYSYVFSRRDSVFQKENITRQDFNVAGIPINPGGELELGVSVIKQPDNIPDSHGGWSVGAQHYQKLGGDNLNKVALQYGRGPGVALGLTGDPHLDNSATSWRVVETLDLQIRPKFGIQLEALYQRNTNQTSIGDDWLSLGFRPVFGLTDTTKLLVEFGFDRIEADEGDRWLSKNTIALAWSPNGTLMHARPEVRLFVTQAYWSRAAQEAANKYNEGSNLSSTGAFGSSLNGTQAGIQVEYWW